MCLDFDGVLCDSEREVSTSGLEACQQYWPHLFGSLDGGERQRILASLRAVRPRLIKGFEVLAMARLLLEDKSNEQLILADWEPLLEATLRRWGEDAAALAAAFEAHRSQQMSRNSERWLSLNPLYPGVAAALADSPYPFYIASSKAARRLVPLLSSCLGMEVDEQSPRLFASLIPPNEMKIDALRTIMKRPVAAGATLHFVDDRFETLHAIVTQAPDLSRWKLYLADWGYNTPEERQAAAQLPGVRLLALPEFCELLRWGIVMRVDDGCEPTAEEVAAGLNGSTSVQH
ncbi:hypothetical protein D9Q98_008710 [Chlorella vulgaris]|uniref:HAD family hydrolase n=1 Tax=Chlorella vulgaris TaxID=3077 RepID=A0A9D4TIJ6_CHLVU|nr:hypothetical protein D9Q98_008710 [Chlorella vulgaris]